MSQNLLSAAVVIGALRANILLVSHEYCPFLTPCILMDFHIHIDAIIIGLPNVFFKGPQLEIS